MLSLKDPIDKLRLMRPAALKAMHNLGIATVLDLIYHLPRDWQDLSEIKSIRDARPDEKINLKAKLKTLKENRTKWRRLHILQAVFEDSSGSIAAVWFNQPFLRHNLQIGREYFVSGKVYRKETLLLQNPAFELVKADTIHTAGIVPIYQLTEGITEKQMRYFLNQITFLTQKIPDFLPDEIKKKFDFPNIAQTLKDIHFPKNQGRLEMAFKRLKFEELYLFQLALQSFKSKLKSLPAPRIPFNSALVKNFVQSLPFSLTHSQRQASWEILKDLGKPHPMNRLLEGEVGSGKTVVAGLAMFEVASANFQSVLLAPTEILAWQHYQTLNKLLGNTSLSLAILTRSHKIGEFSDIRSGAIKVIVGTHALLQERVQFYKLGLLVVDEQHRFGVAQRSQLLSPNQNGLVPHLLSMTATPIPRTLALAFYGDLDISELRELPQGRKKIITRLVSPEKRAIAYEFIRKEIKAGRQVYVVTPLIDESDKLGVRAVMTEIQNLNKIFPEFQIGLLHGRMSGEEKKETMDKFKTQKVQILVSTSVVEVGVDVPNASVMLIENAERFGLSQLHQLRGRVGRSEWQSYCLLFTENANEFTRERLSAVVKSADGFELAEKDLEMRGAGEIIGTRQSGFIPFKVAKLSDKKLIKLAKEEAESMLSKDPNLQRYPLLKQKVESIAKDAHLE